jgi:flagellar hook assembly protein FlgD
VPKGARNAGTYQDEWGGADEAGKFLSEGEYRAVLIYEDGGNDKRLDLSTTTGGKSYSPTRTTIPNTFEPFAYSPLVFDFTIPQASEVTAFIGNFTTGADERLITFMQRRPIGAGTHRITWNGEESSGKLISLSERETFIIGMFAYTMPDNGVFVRSGAHVSNLQREPSILVPDSIDKPVTKLQFDLSNNANIRMVIHNAETGELVANYNFPDLMSGANELTWNGKNNQDVFVEPGKYRLGLTAIDSNGFQSITQYVVQQVYY